MMRLLRMIGSTVMIVLITSILLEGVLRLFGKDLVPEPPRPDQSTEHLFWGKDDRLGWARQPYSTGYFSNGLFRGHVHNDGRGNRLNSAEGTRVAEYENLFFIGDSTVASLEVDDEHTVPAILEQQLRARGLQLNVINLGVRGFGTDQAVRQALAMSTEYAPVEIIYMHTSNDMFNNNTLKKPCRKFGKGVYLRKPGESSFTEYHYPVPDYAEDYASLVVFDEKRDPVVHEARLSEREICEEHYPYWSGLELFLNRHFYSYRAVASLARAMRGSMGSPGEISAEARSMLRHRESNDVYHLVTAYDLPWHRDFEYSYHEGGFVRRVAADYLEDQMHFLLEQLRTIPTVAKVHVVDFPSNVSMQILEGGGMPLNQRFFSALLAEGMVDSYVNLHERLLAENLALDELECPGDAHFCEEGNLWIATQILAAWAIK